MKKTFHNFLNSILLVVILVSSFGIYHYYGDQIINQVCIWLKIDTGQQNSSYDDLENLFVQLDTNSVEITELEKQIYENQLLIEEKLLAQSTENTLEIEKLKAVNEVFRNRVADLETKNQSIQTQITTIQNQLSLTQSELEELRDQILNMRNEMPKTVSVELVHQNSTYSKSTFTLPSGKKFSDYRILYFIFYNSNSKNHISMVIPVDAFSKYKNFEKTDSSTNNNIYMRINYVSDTQYSIGNNDYMEFRAIYGLTKNLNS